MTLDSINIERLVYRERMKERPSLVDFAVGTFPNLGADEQQFGIHKQTLINHQSLVIATHILT